MNKQPPRYNVYVRHRWAQLPFFQCKESTIWLYSLGWSASNYQRPMQWATCHAVIRCPFHLPKHSDSSLEMWDCHSWWRNLNATQEKWCEIAMNLNTKWTFTIASVACSWTGLNGWSTISSLTCGLSNELISTHVGIAVTLVMSCGVFGALFWSLGISCKNMSHDQIMMGHRLKIKLRLDIVVQNSPTLDAFSKISSTDRYNHQVWFPDTNWFAKGNTCFRRMWASTSQTLAVLCGRLLNG